MKFEQKSYTVLITEYDQFLSKALVTKFTRAGFRVLQANDGEEGLRIATKERPDFVVLDVLMPKLDGLTMLKKIREEDTWGKNVPMLILTNLSSRTESISEVLAKDPSVHCLVKTDWSINAVVEKVREWLDRAWV